MKKKDESRATGHRSEASRQRIEMLDDRSRKETSGDEKSLSKKKRASPVSSRSTKTRGKEPKEDRTEKKREKTHAEKKKHSTEHKVRVCPPRESNACKSANFRPLFVELVIFPKSQLIFLVT